MIYTAVVLIILIAASVLCFNNYSLRYFLLSPPLLVNSFILLYTVIGFYLYWGDNYNFLGVNFADTLSEAYFAISFFAIVFSSTFLYLFKRKKINIKGAIFSTYRQNTIFLICYSLALIVYAIFRVNGLTVPIVNNLLAIIFNSFAVVIGYSIVHRAKWSVILGTAFVLLVVYLGFRYRLVLLFLPVLFFIFVRKKITALKFAKFTMVVFICVGVIAIVGVAREYSSGLQMDRLSGLMIDEVIIKGLFNDTSTVMTTGAFIDYVKQNKKFAYFNQIYYILVYFIPSSIYVGKIYSPVLEYMSIFTNQNNNESGAAVLAFAEYYHTAGYFGVFAFGVLFAIGFFGLYKKALISGDSYYLYAYFSVMALYLSSLTRGYFPQNVQDFVSIIIGLYIVKKKFYRSPKI